MSGTQVHKAGRAPILFLFSDTGGGHRSAAAAIDAALHRVSPGWAIATEMIDVFAECGVFPLREGVSKSYGTMLKVQPSPYPALFHLSNGRTRARIMIELGKPFVRGKFKDLLERTRPSLVVSVHPLLNTLARETINASGLAAPFVTVITDLVTIHHAWTSDAIADEYIVASAEAARVCRLRGIPRSRIHDLGLPVGQGFSPASDLAAARRVVGLNPARQTLLVMVGGEGGGRMRAILRHIAGVTREMNLQVVVICGRDEVLRQWLIQRVPRYAPGAVVLGFVNNVADYMRAADVLLSKAGPGTITEAAACGLPIIVCDYIDGQEAGNLGYVESRGAGVVALEPDDVAVTLRRLLGADPEPLQSLRAGALASARPHAADDIARFLFSLLPEDEMVAPALLRK